MLSPPFLPSSFLEARDTRTTENPGGRYRTGKDLGVTYYEGPGSVDLPGADSAGGGRPVRGGLYNPNAICSIPNIHRLEQIYPSYGKQQLPPSPPERERERGRERD